MDQEILAYTEAEFTRLVSEAFRGYTSLLTLARSPLAHTSLVAPALILDRYEPSSDERGRALRVVLRWAVERLAPTLPAYPMNSWRPYTDVTWQDPLWWGYNLLRHRYLDPLPPDEREAGFTEALIALTGISDVSSYYKERTRAVAEVARLLHEELLHQQSSDEIHHLALVELCRALQEHSDAAHIAGVAATFRGSFLRTWLLELVETEGRTISQTTLNYLLGQRLLQTGDGGLELWMSPPLQAYLHAQQPQAQLIRRHRRAVRFYQEQGTPLQVAWHLRMAGNPVESARLLLQYAPELVGELRVAELRQELAALEAHLLSKPLWFEVQLCLWDLARRLGDRDGALAACRQALRIAEGPSQQAQVYRRFGKLYEDYGQRQALNYYRRAIERFPEDDPELVDTLKDRAWIYIHRKEWDQAEADLARALEALGKQSWRIRADIHNALASLYRQQGAYERALDHVQSARALREENGAWQSVAESWSNEALVYTRMGDLEAALAAYREALKTFQQLGNREAIAIIYLNLGTALQLAGRLEEAVEQYEESLTMLEQIGVPLSQSQACYNLAEAHAALDNGTLARHYWQQGYQLAQEAGLEGELEWYEQIAGELPALRELTKCEEPPSAPLELEEELSPEELDALDIARREGRVTPRRLIKATGISKATATRKLAHLMELELLRRKGKGRGTHYVIVD